MGEVALRIRHALIAAPGVTLANVHRVLSHPIALSQCRRFFLQNPHIEALPFYDTAGAVKHILESNAHTSAPYTAAIAAPSAAGVYGGTILQQDLEDDPQNFTRFFLLAPISSAETVRSAANAASIHGHSIPGLSIPDKLSVAFAIPHRPGSLVHVLQSLAMAGADLTRIESRPVPGKPWQYVFFVDLRLPHPSAAAKAMSVLQSQCTSVKLLGQYGIADSPR